MKEFNVFFPGLIFIGKPGTSLNNPTNFQKYFTEYMFRDGIKKTMSSEAKYAKESQRKHEEATYHIMCRSVWKFLPYRDDEDKDYSLCLLKRYSDKYKCSIYAYCVMDDHIHFHLDPKGFVKIPLFEWKLKDDSLT